MLCILGCTGFARKDREFPRFSVYLFKKTKKKTIPNICRQSPNFNAQEFPDTPLPQRPQRALDFKPPATWSHQDSSNSPNPRLRQDSTTFHSNNFSLIPTLLITSSAHHMASNKLPSHITVPRQDPCSIPSADPCLLIPTARQELSPDPTPSARDTYNLPSNHSFTSNSNFPPIAAVDTTNAHSSITRDNSFATTPHTLLGCWVSGIGCVIFRNSHHVDATVISWLCGPLLNIFSLASALQMLWRILSLLVSS